MAIQTLSLDSMSLLSAEEQLATIGTFNSLPINGEIEATKKSILAFEQQYEMSTKEMLEKVRAGQILETHDIVTWSMLAE